MAGAFRHVTVLHADEDWCQYVVQHFQPSITIESINLTDTNSDDQCELEAAVTSSHVVVLLVTCNFLEELRTRRPWLAAALRARDTSITNVVAATVNVSAETLEAVAEACKYHSSNWAIIDIEVTGNNITERINQIQHMVDASVGTLARRLRAKDTVDPSTLNDFGTHDDVLIIPRTVEGQGDKVALIFSQEKPRGSVTVYADGALLQTERINPFTVTFLVPEIRNGIILIKIKVNNEMFDRISLYTRSTPEFTSVELLRQTHGVTSNSQLDKLLADKFNSSLSSDGHDAQIFSQLVEHTPKGKQDGVCPTLLHWAAANGLQKLCASMMKSPGAHQACHILNCNGHDVADLAKKHGYHKISDLIYDSIEPHQVAPTCDPYVQTGYTHKPPDENADYVVPDEKADYVVPESLFTDAGSDRARANQLIDVQGQIKDGQKHLQDISERCRPVPTARKNADAHPPAMKGATSLADLQYTGVRQNTGAVRVQQRTVSGFSLNSRDSGISNSGDTYSNSGSSAEEMERYATQFPPPVPSRRFGRPMSETAVLKRNANNSSQEDEYYSIVNNY